MSVMQRGIASSVIRPAPEQKTDSAGQNETAYQHAKAALASDARRVQAFAERVAETWPQSTVHIAVNPCSRHWRRGDSPNLSLGVQICRVDGSNVATLAGGADDLGEALRRADSFLRSAISRVMAREFGGDEFAWAPDGTPFGV